MDYVEHSAREGDRWDTLAFTYYGDPHGYERIIAANPHVPIRPFIAAGTPIAVPIIEGAELVSEEDLPPWKR